MPIGPPVPKAADKNGLFPRLGFDEWRQGKDFHRGRTSSWRSSVTALVIPIRLVATGTLVSSIRLVPTKKATLVLLLSLVPNLPSTVMMQGTSS
jgi:hypothetical protein